TAEAVPAAVFLTITHRPQVSCKLLPYTTLFRSDISAKQGLNVEELLEKVLLEAEILDLKANPKRLATGTVVEASLDKGRGYVSRSEEHTSELQSRENLVCRLLLEKKK